MSFGYPYLKGFEAAWYLAGDSPLEQIIVRKWNKIHLCGILANEVWPEYIYEVT